MIGFFLKIILKLFFIFIATLFMFVGIALFMGYMTNNKGLARGDSISMVNIPGKGKRYYRTPDWFVGIIMAAIFGGFGFGFLYYIIYFMTL
ncbi:uncharacterized protein METZ01_LOCUS354252 [marine metagenome]|uniref:Uncharacterized protein n=1 Tax=marine metagenome TaxID=408172 RepID=A0A382RWV5_9ZZZZ